MLSNRQKLILKAIVENYIDTGEPMGSKDIARLPFLKFASSTIRYDMAELEKKGLLKKTHLSSGRIPSNEGLRYYLTKLLTRDEEVTKHFPVINNIINNYFYDPKEAVKKIIQYLSSVSNSTVLSIRPGIEKSTVKSIELIETNLPEAILLVVTEEGELVYDKIIIYADYTFKEFKNIINVFSNSLKGYNVKQIQNALFLRLAARNMRTLKFIEVQLLQILLHLFSRFNSNELLIAGSNHSVSLIESDDVEIAKEYLKRLNSPSFINYLKNDKGLTVRFGDEIDFLPSNKSSLITISYLYRNDKSKAILALIGPNRLSYCKIIPLFEYAAAKLAKI